MRAPVDSFTVAGCTFHSSKRTASHLRWTYWRLKARHPLARMVVMQPCYNTTVKASAGTHDFDACFDVRIERLSWNKSVAFLRGAGWAAWHRTTAQGFGVDHIHMISIPPGLPYGRVTAGVVLSKFTLAGLQVGEYVPAQVEDYYAHALGLKGQHRSGDDPTWHPRDINKTVFKQTR